MGSNYARTDMIATSLRTGQPLPQVTPCPLLDKFMATHYKFALPGGLANGTVEDDDYGLPANVTMGTLEDMQYLCVFFAS
jgi:hypothetical protein